MSFSFLDSKSQSPTNASSQDLPKNYLPQKTQAFPVDKGVTDYQKFEYPDYNNYKDYIMEHQNNHVYEDNINFNEDLSYNHNSNLFNFDEYFTVN